MIPEVTSVFLRVSKGHLAAIHKICGKSKRSDAMKLQHALVAIITSACAVESLINVLLSLPVWQ